MEKNPLARETPVGHQDFAMRVVSHFPILPSLPLPSASLLLAPLFTSPVSFPSKNLLYSPAP